MNDKEMRPINVVLLVGLFVTVWGAMLKDYQKRRRAGEVTAESPAALFRRAAEERGTKRLRKEWVEEEARRASREAYARIEQTPVHRVPRERR